MTQNKIQSILFVKKGEYDTKKKQLAWLKKYFGNKCKQQINAGKFDKYCLYAPNKDANYKTKKLEKDICVLVEQPFKGSGNDFSKEKEKAEELKKQAIDYVNITNYDWENPEWLNRYLKWEEDREKEEDRKREEDRKKEEDRKSEEDRKKEKDRKMEEDKKREKDRKREYEENMKFIDERYSIANALETNRAKKETNKKDAEKNKANKIVTMSRQHTNNGQAPAAYDGQTPAPAAYDGRTHHMSRFDNSDEEDEELDKIYDYEKKAEEILRRILLDNYSIRNMYNLRNNRNLATELIGNLRNKQGEHHKDSHEYEVLEYMIKLIKKIIL